MDDQYLKKLLEQLDRRSPARSRADGADASQRAAPLPSTGPPLGPAPTSGESTARSGPPHRALQIEPLTNPPGSSRRESPPASGSAGPRLASPARPAARGEPERDVAARRPVEFFPRSPRSLAEARLREEEIEAIALRMLLQNTYSGRDIAEQLRLPFSLMEPLLARFKADQWVQHKAAAPLSDYQYQLAPAGIEVARGYQLRSSYIGPAPVALEDYVAAVEAQSIAQVAVDLSDLDAVFEDLIVGADLKNQIGQALQEARGFFFYGCPGNGKTSIAQRVAQAFGQTIWIPRFVSVEGQIIQLFDRSKHVETPPPIQSPADAQELDRRWTSIRRPTIVAGGELTLEQLEISLNKWTGVCEAPLQMKSNGGTLLIDDFGRQRTSTRDLLNRWIVPLDRGHDYLNLPSGHTIRIPFDQLLVFSTNLQPKDLIDEAFLRRLPYKIEAPDPTESEFRELFQIYGERLGVEHSAEAVEHLLAKHYRGKRRPLRFCQPRDLLKQVRNYCRFNKLPVAMSPLNFDVAVRNYFSLMNNA